MRLPRRSIVGALTSIALALVACSRDPAPGPAPPAGPAMDEVVRLDHVQVIGTHNSYHRRLPPKLFEILSSFDAEFAMSVDYEHPPLDEQLDAGIRQLELDVFADPDGGRFASRAANPLAGLPKETGIAELEEPGFKVLHFPEVDFESSCWTLASCLRTIAAWSADHPRHLPVMVFIEAKDAPVPDVARLGFVTPVPIGAAELDALDAEIRSVFDGDQMLTPDEVRGRHATLRAAVTTEGWPTLAEARGKVLFALINDDAKRAAYVEGHESLRGRAMFTLSGPDAPESALISRPDATTASADIAALAELGFVVRTRADADTVEARAGSVARRDAALASAATWVSTDFPTADAKFGAYAVTLPGERFARCNPVVAPPACRDDLLE
jgi:hypothetical protein